MSEHHCPHRVLGNREMPAQVPGTGDHLDLYVDGRRIFRAQTHYSTEL